MDHPSEHANTSGKIISKAIYVANGVTSESVASQSKGKGSASSLQSIEDLHTPPTSGGQNIGNRKTAKQVESTTDLHGCSTEVGTDGNLLMTAEDNCLVVETHHQAKVEITTGHIFASNTEAASHNSNEEGFSPAVNPVNSRVIGAIKPKEKSIVITNAFEILQQETDSVASDSGHDLTILLEPKTQFRHSPSSSSSSKQQKKKKRKMNLNNSPGSGGAYSLASGRRHHK